MLAPQPLLLPFGSFRQQQHPTAPAAVPYHALVRTAFSPSHVHLLSAVPKPFLAAASAPDAFPAPVIDRGEEGARQQLALRGSRLRKEALPLPALFPSALPRERPLAKSRLAPWVGCPRGSVAAWAALVLQTAVLMSIQGERDQTGVLGGPGSARSRGAGSWQSGS